MSGSASHRALALAIVSYPSTLEPVFEDIAQSLAKSVGPGFALERCQDPGELLFLVRRWHRRGRSIARLDLHGHGAGGEFKLGDGLLFSSDGTGYGVAAKLGPLLARGAQVRLLGCRTATEGLWRRGDGARRSGETLLRDLEARLRGGRTVWGTTDDLGPRHLAGDGLTATGARLLRRAG